MPKRGSIILIAAAFFIGAFVPGAGAAIKLKLMAVNPSDTQKQLVPIKYFLPKEIRKEDVTDTGGMQIEYYPKAGCFFLYKEVDLEAKATATLRVTIADKWDISPEDIDLLRSKAAERLKTIEKTDQYPTAKLLADKIQARLDDIANSQAQAGNDIVKKIELSRVNKEIMSQMDNDIQAMDYLGDLAHTDDDTSTVKYAIDADNPSDEVVDTRVTHFLPKEIKPENIIQPAGFSLGYDSDSGQFYLWKNETFQPKEKKHFEVEIKDIWRVPEKLLESYRKDAELVLKRLEVTKYKDLAMMMRNDILRDINDIETSQGEVTTLKERIALYPINAQREERVRKNLERMKALLGEMAKQDPAPANTGPGKLGKGVSNILRDVKALEGIRDFSQVLVKKFIPKAEVWRVILDTVVFTIVFTFMVTLIWALRLNKEDSKKLKKVEKAKSEKTT